MKELVLMVLIGGAIGYFTNYLAIKMLFRPLHEKYILGIKVPFTPGLIPAEKSRMAVSVGKAIDKMTAPQNIIKYILKDEILESLFMYVNSVFESNLVLTFVPVRVRFKVFEGIMSKLIINLPDIIDRFDVKNFISQVIMDYDPEELEKLVLQVAEKELRSITVLGGFLGAIVGLLQFFVIKLM